MKAVMISIQPKWVEKIASGEKTIEVRKTRPKMGTPFKCYIYCTKHKERLIEVVHKGDDMGYCVYNEDTPMFIKTFADMALLGTNMAGKVIGEFVCDRVIEWKYLPDHTDENEYEYYIVSKDGHDTCLTYDEIENYGQGKPLYGWNISNLKIYDKPKSLEMFPVGKIARDCGYGNYNIYDKILTRPPQSWCYVEEQDNER